VIVRRARQVGGRTGRVGFQHRSEHRSANVQLIRVTDG
jgi:hypothetical protein